MRMLLTLWLLTLTLLGGCAAAPSGPPAAMAAPPKLDAPWIPSAPAVISAMLAAANVGVGDTVYDLGCGEGEIVIAAALRGARGVGVDLDPERIVNARLNAAKAGVTERVTFIVQDLFVTDISAATVVTLYLGPDVNRRLRPKLLSDLRPGTRIVSHDFSLGDWAPEQTIPVPQVPGHVVYLWHVPPR